MMIMVMTMNTYFNSDKFKLKLFPNDPANHCQELSHPYSVLHLLFDYSCCLRRVMAQDDTAGQTLLRLGFHLILVHMGFVVAKGVLVQAFCLSNSVFSRNRHIIIHFVYN